VKRAISKLTKWLIYGGSFNLSDQEKELLKLAGTTLSKDDQIVFTEQVARVERVKRLHQGRMVTFAFDDVTSLQRVSDAQPELLIAKIKLEGKGAKVSVKIFLHRGLLSSLEYSASPKILDGQISVLQLSTVGKNDSMSVADEIDSSEHAITKN
jgi:hypothetical protein